MTNVPVVHPLLPVRTVKDLLELAEAWPDTLSSAFAGVGSSNHLLLVLFNMLSNAGIGHVPYKGAAPAVTDVMGGPVAMTFAPIAAVVPYVKAGRLRALAVTAGKRSPMYPALPAIAEAGVAGYDAAGWNALLAPRALPHEMIARVHAALRESLAASKVRGTSTNAGAKAVDSAPDKFARFLQKEIAKWGKVIRVAEIAGQ